MIWPRNLAGSGNLAASENVSGPPSEGGSSGVSTTRKTTGARRGRRHPNSTDLEIPAAEGVPLELMPARERSPDVLFTSLGERPECVWVSHEDMIRPV